MSDSAFGEQNEEARRCSESDFLQHDDSDCSVHAVWSGGLCSLWIRHQSQHHTQPDQHQCYRSHVRFNSPMSDSFSIILLLYHCRYSLSYSMYIIAKIFFAYATLASFLLQFYVPMDFLEPPLYEKMKLGQLMYYFPRHHGKVKLLVQICFRTSLVVLTG